MKCVIFSYKQTACTFLLTFCSTCIFSQVEKGQWLIGGSAALSISQANAYNRKERITTFNLLPAAGYFFFDRFAGGLRTNFGIESYKSIPGNRHRTTSVSVGPFLRYYFLATDKIVNLFADASYGYTLNKYTQFDGIYDESYHSHLLSFKAGPAIFLNEHTALEITLGYNYSTRGPIDTFKTNTIQLGVGLQFHLDKRHKRN